MGSPNALRGVSTSGNLSARDAITAGVVDMLAADYHPGALLQAVWLIAREGILPLHEAVRLITTDVAAGVGLHDRGSLASGLLADITLVSESHRAHGTGHPRVRGTLRAGKPIFLDRHTSRKSVHVK